MFTELSHPCLNCSKSLNLQINKCRCQYIDLYFPSYILLNIIQFMFQNSVKADLFSKKSVTNALISYEINNCYSFHNRS